MRRLCRLLYAALSLSLSLSRTLSSSQSLPPPPHALPLPLSLPLPLPLTMRVCCGCCCCWCRTVSGKGIPTARVNEPGPRTEKENEKYKVHNYVRVCLVFLTPYSLFILLEVSVCMFSAFLCAQISYLTTQQQLPLFPIICYNGPPHFMYIPTVCM